MCCHAGVLRSMSGCTLEAHLKECNQPTSIGRLIELTHLLGLSISPTSHISPSITYLSLSRSASLLAHTLPFPSLHEHLKPSLPSLPSSLIPLRTSYTA